MVVAEESRQSRVDEALRFLNVVCGALIVSVGAFAMVAWFVASGPGAQGVVGPPVPTGVAVFGAVVGVALLLAAPVIYRKMLERATGGRAQERETTALESFRLATMLAFILREGAAIVGLMLTLLTNEPMWCYALAGMAIVAMIWGWPRPDQLDALLAAQSPA
jgi:hypothetical protein